MKKVNAKAGLHTEVIEYKHGDEAMEGYLAFKGAVKGRRPLAHPHFLLDVYM